MPDRQLSVAIIGGGLGGLAAALSLRDAGLDVRVYEQARVLSEVGAGVQLSPNASRILRGLGLAGELEAIGVRPPARHQRRWENGRTLLHSPLGDVVTQAFGSPHYQLHRADLLSVLVGALPANCICLGRRLVDFDDGERSVEARFEDGTRVEVDVLVGADGIHSTVRRLLFGPESPRFTGCVAYRGLVPAERLEHIGLDTTAQTWLGPGRHFVHYYVRQRRLLNFVACIAKDSWHRESWTDRGEITDALAAFEGWHPDVLEILRSVDETFVWALFDRAPLDAWSVGRVTLLGDACHPMLPFMAQGAAQAVEDGATLAACLVAEPDVADALRRYERVRLPRTARVQALSSANKTRFHLPDGREQEARDAEMASVPTDWEIEAVAWIWGHDARVLDGDS